MGEHDSRVLKRFPSELRRKIELSRLTLGFERIWPLAAAILTIIACYLALGFLGVFSGTPLWLRICLAILFGAGLITALVPLVRWRFPTLAEGVKRLDLNDATLHRPLATLSDRPAGHDPISRQLWEMHRRQAEAEAARVVVKPPQSQLPQRDRYALGALSLLLLVAGAFVAGDERSGRLWDAFHFGAPRTPPVPPRLDAWVDPPAYTGRAPIFLSGPNSATTGPIQIPIGSQIVVRVFPADDIAVEAPPTLRVKSQDAKATAKAGAPVRGVPPFEQRFAADGDGVLVVKRGSSELTRYDLRVTPDRKPAVELIDVVQEEKGQGLRLKYRLDDDYGIARAEAVLERPEGSKRTLVPAPEIFLSGRIGEFEAPLAAPEHPWAGARLTLRLKVEDDIAQTAESASREIMIPARRFENPVSRALVEQRRNIVLNPDDRRTPQIALDSLLVAPEIFTTKSGDFIMLSMAARKMRAARTDNDLKALADYLWETAVAMDEGNLTQAERNLRNIEERLREAIERGATPEELRRLMEEMRQAMNDMLRELMERAERDPQQNQADRNNPNQRSLTQRDLQDMLKRIEELYKQGDTAKAQELLKQLQDLLKNLETARRRGTDPRQREMGEMMNELEKMQRDQERLRDETFRDRNRRDRADRNRQRERQQQGQRGQQGQQDQDDQDGDDQDGDDQDGDQDQAENGEQDGQQGQQGLTERQQALRDRLNRLRERMRQQGMQDQEGMEGADEGMGDATENLKRQNRNQAGRGQQRAIDELGRAGRGMAEQMQREGDAQGEGEGDGLGNPNQNPRGRAQQSTDPLGRPLPGERNQMDNSRVKIPESGNIEGSVGERAQRVLEELRRRFGEIERPREELDYIERLLRRN